MYKIICTFVYTTVINILRIEQLLKTNSSLPLSKKTVVALLYTSNFINSKLNDVLKPYDVSIQQFNVLRILRGQNGQPASLTIVQERMISKMSTTTRLVDKLIKKGFVEKDINIENRRKTDIHITKDGLNFQVKANDLIESI